MNKKRNVQIFGGTQKYFGGTFGFYGTQVEKHWLKESLENELEINNNQMGLNLPEGTIVILMQNNQKLFFFFYKITNCFA
jgi:hypothetical protein